MKLKQLVESKVALENVIKGVLPLNEAWNLKKYVLKVNDELKTYDELRSQKIVEYGEEIIKDEKPTGAYSVKTENMEKFYNELETLLDKEVQEPEHKISVSKLKDYKNVKGEVVEISVNDLIVLDWLIVE